MDRLKIHNQKGFGVVFILAIALILVVVIGALIFFVVKKPASQNGSATGSQNGSTSNQITEDQVPYKICATGDPDQCDDPVSNDTVDKVKTDELP